MNISLRLLRVTLPLAALVAGCASSSMGTGKGGAGGIATGGQTAGAGGVATGGHLAGGTSGAAGAGAAGSSGRGGVGGAAGVAGSAGAAGGGSGAGGVAGAGGAQAACHQVQCLRAYRCVTACGATPQSVGCCPCQAPTFDEAIGCGGAGGTGGAAGTTYVGCRFVGGIDRFVVAKRDVARDRCFGVVLDAPGQSPVSFLTLPPGLGLEGISIGPAATCPTRALSPAGPATVGGTVSQVAGPQGAPTALDVHVTVNYTSDAGAPASEDLIASSVDVTGGCL